MIDEEITTDVYSINRKTFEKHKKTNQFILKTFRYKGIDFVITQDIEIFDVCFEKDGELYSVWNISRKAYILSEVSSIFRDEFDKHDITKEKIDLFLEDPKQYKKKFLRKKS